MIWPSRWWPSVGDFFSALLVLCVQTLSVSSLHRHPAICNPQFCLVCASTFNGPDYRLACNDIGTILCRPLLSTILTRLGLLCHSNPIFQQTYRIIVIKLCSSMLGSLQRCDYDLIHTLLPSIERYRCEKANPPTINISTVCRRLDHSITFPV